MSATRQEPWRPWGGSCPRPSWPRQLIPALHVMVGGPGCRGCSLGSGLSKELAHQPCLLGHAGGQGPAGHLPVPAQLGRRMDPRTPAPSRPGANGRISSAGAARAGRAQRARAETVGRGRGCTSVLGPVSPSLAGGPWQIP